MFVYHSFIRFQKYFLTRKNPFVIIPLCQCETYIENNSGDSRSSICFYAFCSASSKEGRHEHEHQDGHTHHSLARSLVLMVARNLRMLAAPIAFAKRSVDSLRRLAREHAVHPARNERALRACDLAHLPSKQSKQASEGLLNVCAWLEWTRSTSVTRPASERANMPDARNHHGK